MIELASYGKLRQLTGIPRETFQSLVAEPHSQYRSFDTTVGDKWRHIDNPRRNLKFVQSRLLRKVLHQVGLPEHMYGARPGASVIDHAKLHAGQECILTLDLRNCYPSTTHVQVHSVFMDRVGCSPTLANVLTRLCTLDFHLPQGAPTSGYLAHLALVDLFNALSGIAKRGRLRLSFYVDDIAMSGSNAAVRGAKAATIEAVLAHDHAIRNKKKKVMEGDDRVVTNLQVRATTQIVEEDLEDLKDTLVRAAQAGTVTLSEYRSLVGRIAWVKGVSVEQARPLDEILSHVRAGTVLTRKFFNNIPCNDKATCKWRQQERDRYVASEKRG